MFAGMRTSTVINAMKLKVEPQELNCATRLVGILLIPAWAISIKLVSRKVYHLVGT